MAPVWLKREMTIEKMITYVDEAAEKHCQLVVFGEALLPGYPFWVEHTEGARFESEVQKELYAHYLDQAVDISQGHLNKLCEKAKTYKMGIIAGCMEKAPDRGGHSVYCTLVYIDSGGEVRNTHRKLMPTYEERLVWAQGDGHGLNTFPLGKFTLGGLNCWENWMPLARTSLYAQGEDLHVAIWPGNVRNTREITPFMAREGRSFVVSVGGLMRREDVPDDIPYAALIRDSLPDVSANGGSCAASPSGEWLLAPVEGKEGLAVVTIDHAEVRKERHNFDPAGHYSRPDVLSLNLDKSRQSNIKIES